MSESAQKGRTSKQNGPKIQVLSTEETNYEIDQLAGNVGTPEADNRNYRAVEQQQQYDNEVEKEYSEGSVIFQILMNWIKQERIL